MFDIFESYLNNPGDHKEFYTNILPAAKEIGDLIRKNADDIGLHIAVFGLHTIGRVGNELKGVVPYKVYVETKLQDKGDHSGQ